MTELAGDIGGAESSKKFCSSAQRRQSGLKSGGTWISIFPGKFPRNFNFFRQVLKKFQFFKANFRKILIISGNLKKNSFFQAKIAHLQLLLGKLFYFSSKVTTFEHTSCT